jgi:hypothetical protein
MGHQQPQVWVRVCACVSAPRLVVSAVAGADVCGTWRAPVLCPAPPMLLPPRHAVRCTRTCGRGGGGTALVAAGALPRTTSASCRWVGAWGGLWHERARVSMRVAVAHAGRVAAQRRWRRGEGGGKGLVDCCVQAHTPVCERARTHTHTHTHTQTCMHVRSSTCTQAHHAPTHTTHNTTPRDTLTGPL